MIRIMNTAKPLLVLSMLTSGAGFHYKASRTRLLTKISTSFFTNKQKVGTPKRGKRSLLYVMVFRCLLKSKTEIITTARIITAVIRTAKSETKLPIGEEVGVGVGVDVVVCAT